jgi:mannose-6-phosphate isomerase
LKDQILRLHGKVQHYAWGGYEFIPQLLKQVNIDNKPCAEYWLGAHPSASSNVDLPDGTSTFLYDAVQQLPFKYLGEEVYTRFGELPYLFKVLDVREMLSIQVHPTKEEAIKGFDREEAEGIPINAPHRNYKDRNHKPEVMIALSDFWLLHGFKKEAELLRTLEQVPSFQPLLAVFNTDGYYGLYKHVMEFPVEASDKILLPVIHDALATEHTKDQPGYWVEKMYTQAPANNIDKGIFSIYFFNIVHIPVGQAIFQSAGVPHAYLEGQNVELMANSDNVLRGGLTPKHVDVPELLKHTTFEGIEPNMLAGAKTGAETKFDLPVEDFGISAIHLNCTEAYRGTSNSAEIFLLMKGAIQSGDFVAKEGEAFIILPGTNYKLTGTEDAVLYKAFVPAKQETK